LRLNVILLRERVHGRLTGTAEGATRPETLRQKDCSRQLALESGRGQAHRRGQARHHAQAVAYTLRLPDRGATVV
jgi:hypothetical protein